ncbi:DUF3892 domain-containing protein [Bacillus solimangrovi]|uniref:DUF3892 domain-containing protein n=1 Tax=Bacillus solimangrovi TaxID=1305675 RepID=A0A1E5LK30_9BACI|nr:DUF3892 domain-containing protein [Bacillus solimangrovi]OEH94459.1 hypothetical protein BFG57_08340 [Bacillus solimangrovi]
MNDRFEASYNKYVQQSQDQATNELNNDVQPNQEQIVAVRKNSEGDLIAFKTNSGRELDYVTALEEAKAGKLAHVDVFHKYGRDIIRSEPDGIKSNNLDNLEEF